jgi:hypothetical protein
VPHIHTNIHSYTHTYPPLEKAPPVGYLPDPIS